MTQVHRIRELFFEKGLSYAEIARATAFDVKTVKKYVSQDDFNVPLPRTSKPRSSKLDRYKAEIDQWLEDDRRSRRKQRHTARRVFHRLQERYGVGFDCSYRLVARYVAEQKRTLYGDKSVFALPLEHRPGEAQVDFGEAEFYEGSRRRQGFFLNLSFPHSNAGYVQLFKGQNQQCLMEGLKNIFTALGGVPVRLWMDNPRTIVARVLSNGARMLTEEFARFQNHYGFEVAFCNPGQGHEKGHVEGKVGYHRRNLLVPVPRVEDVRAFNRELLERCDADRQRPHYRKGVLIEDLFREDREQLRPLPSANFDVAGWLTVRTDAYAQFTLNRGKHRYSTAPRWAHSTVWVRLTAYEVVVMDESHREIQRHARLYGEETQVAMDWLPYLTQLARRPAALKYTGVYDLLPNRVKGFLANCDLVARREALQVLAQLSREAGFPRAVAALEGALAHGTPDRDSVLAQFRRLNPEVLQLQPLILSEHTPVLPPVRPQVQRYDQLFLGRGEDA